MVRTNETLRALIRARGGILALDEQLVVRQPVDPASSIVTSAELRRRFHETCVATTGLSRWIGAICLFEEALRQRVTSGATLPSLIADRDMIAGVRIDTGSVPFGADQAVADGVDGLETRLQRAFSCGARFATWHLALRSDAEIERGDAALAEDCERAAAFIRASRAGDLLPLLSIDDHSQARDAASHRVFFRRIASMLAQCDAAPSPVAMKVSLREAPREAELLEEIRTELPFSVAILFLGVDRSSAARQPSLLRGGAAGLPWPLRFALGGPTQACLLASWGDGPARRQAVEHLLLDRARHSSMALNGAIDRGKHQPACFVSPA